MEQTRTEYVRQRAQLYREALAAELARLSSAAPHDIEAHAKLLHRTDRGDPVVLPRHARVWAQIAQLADRYRWVCVVAPPGYIKSTFWSVIYPAWEIGRNPRARIAIIGNTASQAYEFSKAVQGVVESQWYQRTYGPDVQPDYKRGWAQDSWYVKGAIGPPNPTMLAAGVGGPILGKRFDTVVLDDPTTYEQARSKATMEAQRVWLTRTLFFRFAAGERPPGGTRSRMVVVLTRWGSRDLVPVLEDNGFKIVRMPALGFWDATYDIASEKWVYGVAPLWPEAESQETLLAEQEHDPIGFDLVKQGEARAGEGGKVFDPDTFQRGTCPYGALGGTTCWVDTAGGKSRLRGDYFCMAALGQNETLPDPGAQVWVVEINRDRYTAPEQERQVEYTAERLASMGCPPRAIWIATSNEGGASLYQRLVARTRLPLHEATEREDKEFRAIPLSNAYRSRYVWHDSAPWNRAYELELEYFPNGDHDDQVDAAAGAYKAMADPGVRVRTLRSHSRR